MSILDDIGWLVEGIVSDTKDLIDDLSNDAKQLGDELLHINDDNYVSPYAKKAEAKSTISRADEKFAQTKNQYDRHMSEVKDKLEANYRKKQQLLGRLGTGSCMFERNPTISIMPSTPTMDHVDFALGEFLGIFGHELRDSAASSYLEDAKDYSVSTECAIAQIHLYETKLNQIEEQMALEDRILDTLTTKISNMSHSDCHETASALKQMLSIAICDQDGEIRKDYIRYFETLKSFS